MASAPELILRTLDRHLTGTGTIRLLGGAALILGYERTRTTEDADLLLDDPECQALIDDAGFSSAVELTNQELEPRGLYLTHIWGPEQQILTPSWRAACRPIEITGLTWLSVTSLGPLDLVTSKLARGDDADLADVDWLIERERLSRDEIEKAVNGAMVPAVLREVFEGARERLFSRIKNL